MPQVLRDSKFRCSNAGADFTEEEKAGWQRQLSQWFQKPEDPSDETNKKRRKRENFVDPRIQSWDLLMSLENAIRQVTGKGFERFTDVEGKLARNEVPDVLVWCLDMLQWQWTAGYFLMREPKIKCCLVMMMDPFHYRHNSYIEGIVKAGQWSVILRKVVEINLCYGPWNGGAWWSEMVDAANEISRLFDPNDKLLMLVWPQICMDLDYHSEDQQDEAARIRFLQKMPHFPIFTKKPPRAAVSRWFSYQQGFRFGDAYHHTKLLALLYLCIKKHWVKHVSVITSSLEALEETLELEVEDDDEEKEMPPPVVGKSTRPLQAVKLHTKGKFLNTCAAVTRGLADLEFTVITRIIGYLSGGFEYEHSYQAEYEHQTPQQQLDWYIGVARFSYLKPFQTCFSVLEDLQLLRRMGFMVDFGRPQFTDLSVDSPEVAHQDWHAGVCVKLIGQWMKSRCGGMAYFSGTA